MSKKSKAVVTIAPPKMTWKAALKRDWQLYLLLLFPLLMVIIFGFAFIFLFFLIAISFIGYFSHFSVIYFIPQVHFFPLFGS